MQQYLGGLEYLKMEKSISKKVEGPKCNPQMKILKILKLL